MDRAAETRLLGWVAGLAPTLAILLGWIVGAGQGHLPVCIPNIDGCLPTSATGRAPPEAFVFKPLMCMGAVAICMLWTRVGARTRRQWFFAVSLVGALALVIYAIALGATGEAMRAVRRLGVSLFFLTSLVCQVTFVVDLKSRRPASRRWLRPALTALLAVQVAIGLSSFFIADWVSNRHAFQNAVEWNYLPLLCVFFVLVGYFEPRKPLPPA
ncbi:MAG: hypothetical protein AAFN78_06115 [Pseudomonadota bacterium]